MDAPAWFYKKDRTDKEKKEFSDITRADIEATIKFLYKRGMWSKYHFTQWKKALSSIEDEETLHLWWDAIVSGAMFEVEPMLSERLEALEEFEEDSVEKEKMMCRRKKLMMKKKMG